MFRKMRRFKQQISDEKCVEILTNEPRGVLALYGENGYPYALPLDHLYDDGKLYFHCAAEGHKIDAIKANPHASYCVMDEGFRNSSAATFAFTCQLSGMTISTVISEFSERAPSE